MAAFAKRQQPPWNPPSGSSRKGLHIFNSLTNTKVPFVPEKGNNVSWYICGPTVYDSSHLGHARNYVTFDIIRRILEDYFGYHVSAVMNITDVDDKIILRARRNFLFAKYLEENKEWSDQVRADLREAIDTYKTKMTGKIADLLSEAEKLKQAKQSQAAHTAELEANLLQTFLQNAKTADEHLQKIVSGGDTTTFADFSKNVFDPLSELLDKRRGSTVNDQEIFRKHAAFYEKEYLEDMLTLGVRMPDVLTRVSEYINEIIETTKKIIENGFAYESNGSVYFDTQAFSSHGHFYAKLEPTSVGNEKLANEGEGALSQTKQTEKRSSNDFALWKKSKAGEPQWESPWGAGRPGWHIECTAMACSIFGKTLDIHSGGSDLRFPHHDNEIAQAEAQFCSHAWVHYFLHSGHLHIEGLKMAKSLKNFITIREALQKCTPKQLRYMFLLQSWRNVMNFSYQNIEEAQKKEKTFIEFFIAVKNIMIEQGFGVERTQRWEEKEAKLYDFLAKTEEDVHNALADDFDTGSAVERLIDLVTATNSYIQGNNSPLGGRKAFLIRKIASFVSKILKVFGIQEGDSDLTIVSDSNSASSSGVSELNRDAILAPYLRALAQFRQDIRTYAKEKKTPGEMLKLCDHLRDEVMVPLGVRLEDAGEFPYKLQDAAQLLAEREQAKKMARENAIQKAKNALGRKQKDLETWESKSQDPKEFYSKFWVLDEKGEPQKDAKGQIQWNSEAKKNFPKDFAAKQKNFDAFKQKIAADPQFLTNLREEIEKLKTELAQLEASS